VKNKIILLQLVIILILGIRVETLKTDVEIEKLRHEIIMYLNSDEAKATERFNKNVEQAINKRRVQETGVCEN
jgi:hypothetical protein